MSQLFASGGQSIRASASASALPMNSQGWFPLGLTGLILQSRGLSRGFLFFFFFWGSITLAKTLCLHEFCFEIQIPLRRSYRVCEESVRNSNQYTGKEKLVEVSWRKGARDCWAFRWCLGVTGICGRTCPKSRKENVKSSQINLLFCYFG